MQLEDLSPRLSDVAIPISCAVSTVAFVTITAKIFPQKRDLASKNERIAEKRSSSKVCSEGSSTVIHPNVYAFLLDDKALPVPGPTIEIDCNGKVSIGIYP